MTMRRRGSSKKKRPLRSNGARCLQPPVCRAARSPGPRARNRPCRASSPPRARYSSRPPRPLRKLAPRGSARACRSFWGSRRRHSWRHSFAVMARRAAIRVKLQWDGAGLNGPGNHVCPYAWSLLLPVNEVRPSTSSETTHLSQHRAHSRYQFAEHSHSTSRPTPGLAWKRPVAQVKLWLYHSMHQEGDLHSKGEDEGWLTF